MFRPSFTGLIFILAVALTAACGSDTTPDETPNVDAGQPDSGTPVFSDEGTSVRFSVTGDGFFDTPFPSDTRLAEDGSFDLSGWEETADIELLQIWFAAMDDLVRGWGLVSGIFSWFEASIDESTLPQTLEESVDTTDGFPSVALVDVDPDSPETGRLFPLYCRYKDEEGTKHPAHHLACRSPFGVVRRANTTYAFVVTNDVLDSEGSPVAPSAEMASLLAGVDVGEVEAAPYVAAAAALEELGLAQDNIANLTLLTTGDPTARLRFVNEFYDSLPEPTRDESKDWEIFGDYDDYLVLAGYYDVPNVQNGEKPYSDPPDGKLALDENGDIELVQNESIRFLVTIPKGPMPADGWPVMLYLHGSGGTSLELLHRGERTVEEPPPLGSGPASTLATYGWAGFAADFPFHDSRFDPPDTTGLQLYNLLGNPRATIDNFIVSANEVTLHARLLAGLTIDPAVDPEGRLDAGDSPDGLIRFDTDQFGSMGQSMGSTLGIPAVTIDENIDALVPSGAGGVLVEVASTGTKPIQLSVILRAVLRYGPGEIVDSFDFPLHVIQTLWDFVDPVVHSRHVFDEPYEGSTPPHVYMPAGLADGYFSPEAQAGVTAGMGLEFAGPILQDRILVAMGYRGVGTATDLPVSGNGPNGVTAVVTQHEPSVLDGHNVTFQLDEVKAIYGCFFKTLASGTPEVRAPEDATPELCP